jgi:hypothetical protein
MHQKLPHHHLYQIFAEGSRCASSVSLQDFRLSQSLLSLIIFIENINNIYIFK